MIWHIYESIKLNIIKNKYILLFYLYLLAIAIFVGESNYIKTYLYSALLVFVVLYFSRAIKFGFLLYVPVILGVSLELGYRIFFQERVSVAVLQSIVDTNQGEAIAMIIDSLWLFFIVFVSFTVSILLFRASIKSFSRNLFIILAVTVIVLTIFPFTRELFKDHKFIQNIKSYPEFIGEFYYRRNNLVFGDLAMLASTQYSKAKYNQNIDRIYNISITGTNNNSIPLVVFIIGESSIPKNYSVYGYATKTTPHLDSLVDNSNYCIFNDAHSLAPITRDSIAMSLSFHTPENEDPMFSEWSVIQLAQKNNYNVYWLGAQSLFGLYGSKYGYLAQQSDSVQIVDADDKIINLLNLVIHDNDDRKFIIIHLRGSHKPYINYDQIDSDALPLANEYDKTIHKTDRLLGQIFDLLNNIQNQYMALYTSDHGEIVGKGHGINKGGADQYLVPYIIGTNIFDKSICKYVDTLRNHRGNLSSIINKFVLLEALGYKLDIDYINKEISNDRVLHSDGEIYSWEHILGR